MTSVIPARACLMPMSNACGRCGPVRSSGFCRLPRPLLLDHYYLGGSLNSWQWSAGHLFREERLLLHEARARHQVRWSAAVELKPRKAVTGFSMSSVAIERALGLKRWLEPQWYEWALGLIGERMTWLRSLGRNVP